MPLQAILPYIPSAISLAQQLFGEGDTRRKDAIARLEKIAREGTDPQEFYDMLDQLRAEAELQGNRASQQLASKGISPTGSLARAEKRAAQRSIQQKAGALQTGFRRASKDAQIRANQALIGAVPEDTTNRELLGAGLKFAGANLLYPGQQQPQTEGLNKAVDFATPQVQVPTVMSNPRGSYADPTLSYPRGSYAQASPAINFATPPGRLSDNMQEYYNRRF